MCAFKEITHLASLLKQDFLLKMLFIIKMT